MIIMALLVGGLYAASDYVDIHGVPARVKIDTFFHSSLWREGVKDMRTWLAAVLRVAGDKVEEGISSDDEQQLKNVIESDLRKQIEGVKRMSAQDKTH